MLVKIFLAFQSSYFALGNDPEVVKQSEIKRFRDPILIDQIIEIDNEWRKCKLDH